MQIAAIALKSFGICEETELTFDQPLNILCGSHAQGKTTIANAIRLSFTQRAGKTTDRKGGGAMDNVRLGAKKAEIITGVVTAKGPLQIVTTYGPGASRRNQTIKAGEGKEGEKSPAAAFEHFLDRQSEALSCVLDSAYFFVANTPQKDILAALILPTSHEFKPSDKRLAELDCTDRPGSHPEAEAVSAEMKKRREMADMAEKHLGKFVWDKSPVAVIDQVYSAAYSARKDAKAALGAIYIPAQPQRPQYDAEYVQEKIAECRATVAKEAKKIKGGGTVQVGRIEQSLEQEKEKLTTAQRDYAEGLKRRREIEQAILDAPNLKKAERSAAGRTLWNQLQEQIHEFVREITAQQEAQEIYRDLGANPHCPTCTQKITKEFIASKVDEHKKLEDEARTAKLNVEAEQQGLGDLAEAESVIATHKALTEQKLQNVKDVTLYAERIRMCEDAVKDLEAGLATAKAQETAPADTSALDTANSILNGWEALLSPALNYEATLAQIEQAQKRQQDQKATVADLETLVAYFGDKGIKADLIAQGSATFMATVNSVLAAWGYEAKLSDEADSFSVLTPSGWLPTKQLSGFEEFMFKVALQCAIAVHSKLKIVVIDEAQDIIDAHRTRLFKAVQGMLRDGLLDEAFVIMADNRDTVPVKEGIAYFRMEAGKAVRL